MGSLSEALELNRRIGSPAGIAYTLSCQIELLTAAEDYDTAWQLVERGFEVSNQAAVSDHCLSQLYTTAIRNRLRADDSAGASELVEAAKAHDAAAGLCPICRPDLYESLAAYHIASAEPDLARHYIDQALQIVDYAQDRPGRAALLRLLAQVHAGAGDNNEAGRCLLEAVGIFREIGDQYHLARTLQTWGELGGVGYRQDPDSLTREADEILDKYRIYGTSSVAG